MTPVYHWKLGDIALARICKKVYTKVQVVNSEKGLFYGDKVLGIAPDEDGITITKELCYYVQIIRSGCKMWIPYTCMYLAERSRPFYGPSVKTSPPKPVEKPTPKKRKIKEDHVIPINVKPLKSKEADLNVSFEIRHMPRKQGKYENAFNEFVRRGKEQLFDNFYFNMNLNVDSNEDTLYYLHNVDASTEDKFEMVIKNIVSEKEIDNFLRQCWRYNFVNKQPEIKDSSENVRYSLEKVPITIHAPWCLVCGDKEKLWECTNCPASFHIACRKEWLVTIIHRKNPPKKNNKKTIFIQKILSSTRTIRSVQNDSDKENNNLCPSCMWGPKVGYDDIVWHKLGSCPWWPARILTPGELPSCLLSRSHSLHQWPLKYYDSNNIPTIFKYKDAPQTLEVCHYYVKYQLRLFDYSAYCELCKHYNRNLHLKAKLKL